MTTPSVSERIVILAPFGRDADVVAAMLEDAGHRAEACRSIESLELEIETGAGIAIVTEEAFRTADLHGLAAWIANQPSWSDFPFVLLTERGGGLERNPSAGRFMESLGNVIFLERPFHPMTLISSVRTALRARRRQYEARSRIEILHESEAHSRRAESELRRLNESLESIVDERIAELAAANRQLVDQIEQREKVEKTLRQMQRLEAVGQLTSGVAHDFNNLLTIVIGNINFLERELKTVGIEGKSIQRLSYMRSAAERGAKLTAQLLAFSRRQRLEPKPIDLNETVASMRDLLQSSLGGSVRIETRLKKGLWPALVDPTQIELVILNLAINARDAMQVGGSLTVETANTRISRADRPEEPPPGEYAVISVADNGSGMTADVVAKVFEPFFTTKEVGKGSGLGLSQVLGFAKQSGGGVRIETRPGEGTCVKVFLPRAVRSVLTAAGEPAREFDRRHRSALILLVDDDNAVRDVTGSILRDLGYVVLEAGSGGAALDALGQRPDIDLAVFDFAMPGMNGIELAKQAHVTRPNLPILFVTGYADKSALGDIEDARVIRKPFVDNELESKVRAALEQPQTAIASNVVSLMR